jgi:hypothetical protein
MFIHTNLLKIVINFTSSWAMKVNYVFNNMTTIKYMDKKHIFLRIKTFYMLIQFDNIDWLIDKMFGDGQI